MVSLLNSSFEEFICCWQTDGEPACLPVNFFGSQIVAARTDERWFFHQEFKPSVRDSSKKKMFSRATIDTV